MPTTTHTAPATSPATTASMPLLVGGALAAVLFLVLLFRGSGGKVGTKKLDPKQVDQAKKRYIGLVDKRLSGNVEQYSVLLDMRNMVTGFYEQKGQITGARFQVKQAHCKRCKALDSKEFSLLDPVKLAAATPPLHGEVKRGVRCVATMVPIRAEAERTKTVPAAKSKTKRS